MVCWGANGYGQSDAPAGAFAAVSAGRIWHSCAIRTDASVACWGHNRLGQTDPPSGSFTEVSAGRSHTCGIRTDASVACWGDNESGQSDAPASSFTAVSAADNHSCGLRNDGSIVCWGDNGWGQLDVPTGEYTAVSTGGGHTCGLRRDGSVACWGSFDIRTVTLDGKAGPVTRQAAPAEDAGVHQPAIDALNREFPNLFDGTGCGTGLCPSGELKRWEMAVWLVRVLDRTNPELEPTRFDDIDNELWWAPYTERLADLEVTTGCAAAAFCPEETVTRSQMATFLVRAFDLRAALSPAGFADTAGTTHETNIDAVAAANITTGCKTGPLRYCPQSPVTRAQMATFLARALNLI